MSSMLSLVRTSSTEWTHPYERKHQQLTTSTERPAQLAGKRRRHSIAIIQAEQRSPLSTSSSVLTAEWIKKHSALCSSPPKELSTATCASIEASNAQRQHGGMRCPPPTTQRRATIMCTSPPKPCVYENRTTVITPPSELPILRAQYVARNVQVMVGSRWRLQPFEKKTIRLHTGAVPSIELGDDEASTTFSLPLHAKCRRKGAAGLKIWSPRNSRESPLKLRIRFATPADATIWIRVFRDAIAHAKWIQDVKETNCLAQDATSSVLVARYRPSGEEFVIKVLRHGRIDDGTCPEIQILRKLYRVVASKASSDSTSFVSPLQYVLQYRVIETRDDIRIFMPKYPGHNLLTFLQQQQQPRPKLTEVEAGMVTWRLAESLQALHDLGIVHCDVKLENILLTDVNNVRLIDFGGAYDCKSASLSSSSPGWSQTSKTKRKPRLQTMQSMVGTPGYIAPERIRTMDPPTPAADVFSLGIVLFQMLMGHHPFQKRNQPLVLEDTLALNWNEIQGQLQQRQISVEAQDLLRCMLNPEPQTRITVQEIFCHPWFMLENHKEVNRIN